MNKHSIRQHDFIESVKNLCTEGVTVETLRTFIHAHNLWDMQTDGDDSFDELVQAGFDAAENKTNEPLSAPYNPMVVANTLIKKMHDADKEINLIALQKMMYYAYGWYLAITGNPLFSEGIIKWTYGPLVQSVYHTFKEYGTENLDDGSDTFGCGFFLPSREEEFIDKIISVYGQYTSKQLSSMCSAKGTPWERTRIVGRVIKDDLIKEWFIKVVVRDKMNKTVSV